MRSRVLIECNRDSYAYYWAEDNKYPISVKGEEPGDESVSKLTFHFAADSRLARRVKDLVIGYNGTRAIPKGVPESPGTVFLEWNTKADGSGDTYTAGQRIHFTETEDKEITLYARFGSQTAQSNITYELNGGVNNPGNVNRVSDGQTLTLLDASKPGYSFVSWCTDPKLKKKIVSVTGKAGTNYTVYAKWKANKYTVQYDGNGATSGKTKAGNLTYDKKGKLGKNGFKKTGYSFREWNTAADGSGTAYGAGVSGIYNFTDKEEAVTLYAQWTPIQYKVNFKAPDRSQTMAPAEGTYDTPLVLPACTFTKPGYSFVSWNTKANGKGNTYNAGDEVLNPVSKAGGKITLYPIWNYEIEFDGNGGEGEMLPQVLFFNVKTKLNECTFTREGYTFAGWKAVVNGRTRSFKNKASVKNLVDAQGGTVKLVAQWK